MDNNLAGDSEILEECRKLQQTSDIIRDQWSAEVSAYERKSNSPNSLGVVDDDALFPYHSSLYSLLDCYDGLEGTVDDTVIQPSPAPLPYYHLNGIRRKRSINAVDALGNEIMEIASDEVNFPNSAWAIRNAIMPLNRQEQFEKDDDYMLDQQNEQEEHQRPVRHVNDMQKHLVPRFFHVLMNIKSGFTHAASSDISLSQMFAHDDESNNHLIENGNLARNFSFLLWWEQRIIHERKGITTSPMAVSQALLPFNVYLKVLMYSLSEMQNDHRLARAVLLLMTDCRFFGEEGSGLECLRQLLCVLSFGYILCDGYCHETYISHENAGDLLDDDLGIDAPNHYCSDWWEFSGTVSTLIGYGIENMTNQHASIICAFFMRELALDDSSDSDIPVQKAYLKQMLHIFNSDDFERDEDDDIKTTATDVLLLSAILNGIRLHIVSDRKRLDALSNEVDNTPYINTKDAAEIYQSFQTCVYMLVDVGERILLRLPNNFVHRQLASLVVRGLLEAYIDSTANASDSVACYLAQSNPNLSSVIDPLRYANAVKNASSHPLINSQPKATNTAEKFTGSLPPRDVQDLVKGLFRRNLIELHISCCGYGDFLCWCRLPIQPEPLLFDYTPNFPLENDDEDEELPQEYEWAQDEHGFMKYAHQVACYDFSLLMLVREWNKPWTPQSHLSFSIPFRNAVSSLALCAYRFGVPSSIVQIVNSFLPRSWFHDERISCWCHECQMNQLAQLYRDKLSSRTGNWNGEKSLRTEVTAPRKTGRTLTPCGCKVAMACSKDHWNKIRQEGHKRQCGLPPFRPPFSKEDNLFVREIFEGSHVGFVDTISEDYEDIDQNDDDADSWESVDTNAEDIQRCSMNDKIYSWFNSQSYKIQRREAPPFANFF